MTIGRRSAVSAFVLTLVGWRTLLAGQWQQMPIPQRNPRLPPRPRPGASTDDVAPTPRPDPKELLKENQKALRGDVDQLAQLVQDLKTEADKTDQTGVLSLSFVHKAEAIEKLARQIKSLARAS